MYGEDSVDEDEPVPDFAIPDNMLGEDSVDEDKLVSDVVPTDIMLEEESIDENESLVFNDSDELLDADLQDIDEITDPVSTDGKPDEVQTPVDTVDPVQIVDNPIYGENGENPEIPIV